MSKILINSHTDLDGCGCILVLDYFNIKYDKAEMCDYDKYNSEVEFNKLLEFDEIYCTDYSMSTEIVEKLLSLGKIVKIFDHHESSELLKDIKHENFEIVHDKTRSGTLICYDHFKPKTSRVKRSFRQLIELVNCYDLFKMEDPLWEDALNLNRILYGCLSWGAEGFERYKFIKEYWFQKVNKQDEWSWSDFEKKKIASAIESENKEYINAKSTYKELVDEKGVKFGIAVASKKISIVANRILKESPNISYLVMVNNYEKLWNKLSLRSLEGIFDCTQIASGHLCAAGMEVDPKLAMDVYKGKAFLKYKEVGTTNV